MRHERENHYRHFERHSGQNQPEQQRPYSRKYGRYGERPDSGEQREQFYKMNQAREHDRREGDRGRDDHYNVMYDTSNYYATPRSADYGLPYGSENDLEHIDHFAHPDWVYGDRRTPYRYSMGHNPNYDNPEEGDRYRDFDSRGNHGYRHDASYGGADEFRDFGDDHYGRRDRTGNSYYGHFGGYNR